MKEKQDSDKYMIYIDERRELVIGERESSSRFDKWILTLSGGALGLSITFIDKITPNPTPNSSYLLSLSWLLLLLTILISLASHLTSQAAFRRQRDILDKQLEAGTEEGEREGVNRPAIVTNCLNIASMVFFGAGVIFLCLFLIYNLPTEGGANGKVETIRNKRPCAAQTTEDFCPIEVLKVN